MTDGSAAFGLSQTRPRSFTSDVLLDQLVSETSSKFYVNTEEVRFTMLWWCEWGEGVRGGGEGQPPSLHLYWKYLEEEENG